MRNRNRVATRASYAVTAFLIAAVVVFASPREASGVHGDAAYYIDATRQAAETLLGSDGLPVTALYSVAQWPDIGVSIIRCHDLTCRTGTERQIVDNVPENQFQFGDNLIDLAIGSDGYPVVVYLSDTGTSESDQVVRVWVTKCADVECNTASTEEIFSISTPFSEWGGGISDPVIALGADGNPIVVFGYQSNTDYSLGQNSYLITVHCLDPGCAAVNVVTHDELGDTAGAAFDIVVPSDGKPVIAYSTTSKSSMFANSMMVGRCADIGCSQIDAQLIHPYEDLSDPGKNWPVSSPGSPSRGTTIEVAVDASGLPIIAYIEQYWTSGVTSHPNVWVANCLNASCSSSSRRIVAGMDDVPIAGDVHEERVEAISLAIGPDGVPAIVYKVFLVHDILSAQWAIVVGYCIDQSCTDISRTEVESRFTEFGWNPSIIFTDSTHLLTMNELIPQIGTGARPFFYTCSHTTCDGFFGLFGQVGLVEDPVPPHNGRFVDDDGNVHEENIEKIADADITLGCTPDSLYYCPADPVTRAQMASFLARAFDLPPAVSDHFPDDNGNIHEDNINRLYESDITKGFPDGTYRPGDYVTREQMASFIARAMGLAQVPGNRFLDVEGVHEPNINAIANADITLGCTPDGLYYCPHDNVRRDQMASFLARALDL